MKEEKTEPKQTAAEVVGIEPRKAEDLPSRP